MSKCVELDDHEWITDLDDDQKQVTWCDKCGEFWSDKYYNDSGDADSDNDLWNSDDWLDDLMGQV